MRGKGVGKGTENPLKRTRGGGYAIRGDSLFTSLSPPSSFYIRYTERDPRSKGTSLETPDFGSELPLFLQNYRFETLEVQYVW